MALTIGNGGGGGTILCRNIIRSSYPHLPLRPHRVSPPSPASSLSLSPSPRTSHVVSAKKFASRTGRFDSKNRRKAATIKEEEEESEQRTAEFQRGPEDGSAGAIDDVDDGYFLPKLPGDEPDFWEGPQWDWLGFFAQYMWAFGIAFALVACGIAVVTYNEGATDFKETPVFKESMQSQELLEKQDGSNSNVFESNPTEEAPSLE
ncbi:uncharacterized protein LOC131146643 [Malania oleifera]|uniref:uncharacterized protein LOC131146643 n=1 Tax=Malania oleifera TaxID=397392 RepID=UPI0025ADBAA3|nr:uncharacterized protein LOC131146643 [Malania oleifera]